MLSTDYPPSLRPEISKFELIVGPYRGADLEVKSFTGVEAMSTPYAFEIHLSCRIDWSELYAGVFGQEATLIVRSQDGITRYVHGIVSGAEARGTLAPRGKRDYAITLVPRLWLLSQNHASRIFQDMTVKAIVEEVLGTHQVKMRWPSATKLPVHAYCLQYEESDLDFVHRITAQHGLFYFFDHPAAPWEGDAGSKLAEEVVAFADDPSAYAPIDGTRELPLRHDWGRVDEEVLLRFGIQRRLRPTRVDLSQYHYDRPTKNYDAKGVGDSTDAGDLPIDLYYHRLEWQETDASEGVARAIVEQHRGDSLLGAGRSNCARLAPGRTFAIDGGGRQPEGEYVVTRLTHRGTLGAALEGARGDGHADLTYVNDLECVPSSVAFRLMRPRPRIQQVMETATVVGPDRKEGSIHTDHLGRIKVHFPWDRDNPTGEHTSCWIRPSQAWAGRAWGFQFIPRVGMEVLVGFLGGDTDRPVILGSAYNATHPTPFALPRDATRSGIRTRSTLAVEGEEHVEFGFNEISFEDTKGKEQLFLHAQRDMDEIVRRNHNGTVMGDERLEIYGSRHDHVKKDIHLQVDEHLEEVVTGNHSSHVEGSRVDVVIGNADIEVVGMRTDHVKGRDHREVTGMTDFVYADDVTTRAAGCVTTIVGKTDKKRTWHTHAEGTAKLTSLDRTVISSENEIVLQVGDSSIRIAKDRIEITSAAVTVTGAGGGMSASKDGLKMASAGDAEIRVDQKLSLQTKGATLKMSDTMAIKSESIEMSATPDALKDPDAPVTPPPTTVTLVDQDGKPLAFARYVVTTDDGAELAGQTDKDGKASLDLAQGATIAFPDLAKVKTG